MSKSIWRGRGNEVFFYVFSLAAMTSPVSRGLQSSLDVASSHEFQLWPLPDWVEIWNPELLLDRFLNEIRILQTSESCLPIVEGIHPYWMIYQTLLNISILMKDTIIKIDVHSLEKDAYFFKMFILWSIIITMNDILSFKNIDSLERHIFSNAN